jgi:hypothetical protein
MAVPANFRSDADVLAKHHRFIRFLQDDEGVPAHELRLARRYYSRLFREYAIVDLSLCERRAAEEREAAARVVAAASASEADSARRSLREVQRRPAPQLGLRWRTRDEVTSGRGQFSCGGRRCTQAAALATFELPFRWREIGDEEPRAALVKVRLCPRCAALLPRGGGGGGDGSGGGGGGGRRRARGEEEREEQEDKQKDEAGRSRRRASRSRSRERSPPPPRYPAQAAAAAAAAAAPPPPPPPQEQQQQEPDEEEEDEECLDRLVQQMIEAFEG